MNRQFNSIKAFSMAIATVVCVMSSTAFAQEKLAYSKSTKEKPAMETVTVDDAAYYRSFQAVVFKRLNGVVSVNVEKAPHENITISIFDSQGKLLDEANIGKNELVTKYYDLSHMKKGRYTFVVASQRKTFRKELTLN